MTPDEMLRRDPRPDEKPIWDIVSDLGKTIPEKDWENFNKNEGQHLQNIDKNLQAIARKVSELIKQHNRLRESTQSLWEVNRSLAATMRGMLDMYAADTFPSVPQAEAKECACEHGFECPACTERHDEARRADAEAEAREDRGSPLPFTPKPKE